MLLLTAVVLLALCSAPASVLCAEAPSWTTRAVSYVKGLRASDLSAALRDAAQGIGYQFDFDEIIALNDLPSTCPGAQRTAWAKRQAAGAQQALPLTHMEAADEKMYKEALKRNKELAASPDGFAKAPLLNSESSNVIYQGSCGSCWAVSTLMLLQAQYERAAARGFVPALKRPALLSLQPILSCFRPKQGLHMQSSCDGGHPAELMWKMTDENWWLNSVESLSKFYEEYDSGQGDVMYSSAACAELRRTTGRSEPLVSTRPAPKRDASWADVGGVRLVDSKCERCIKRALLDYGPLVATVATSDLWRTADYLNVSDERQLAATKGGGAWKDHAVLLVGWTPNTWVVKNSWSQVWGIGGFGHVAMDTEDGEPMFGELWLAEQPVFAIDNKTAVVTRSGERMAGLAVPPPPPPLSGAAEPFPLALFKWTNADPDVVHGFTAYDPANGYDAATVKMGFVVGKPVGEWMTLTADASDLTPAQLQLSRAAQTVTDGKPVLAFSEGLDALLLEYRLVKASALNLRSDEKNARRIAVQVQFAWLDSAGLEVYGEPIELKTTFAPALDAPMNSRRRVRREFCLPAAEMPPAGALGRLTAVNVSLKITNDAVTEHRQLHMELELTRVALKKCEHAKCGENARLNFRGEEGGAAGDDAEGGDGALVAAVVVLVVMGVCGVVAAVAVLLVRRTRQRRNMRYSSGLFKSPSERVQPPASSGGSTRNVSRRQRMSSGNVRRAGGSRRSVSRAHSRGHGALGDAYGHLPVSPSSPPQNYGMIPIGVQRVGGGAPIYGSVPRYFARSP